MLDLSERNMERRFNKWIVVGKRPGFEGAANTFQEGSTPPPTAIVSALAVIVVEQGAWRKRS